MQENHTERKEIKPFIIEQKSNNKNLHLVMAMTLGDTYRQPGKEKQLNNQ